MICVMSVVFMGDMCDDCLVIRCDVHSVWCVGFRWWMWCV